MLQVTLVRVAEAVDPMAPPPIQVDQSVDAFLGAVESDRAVTIAVSGDLRRIGERGAQIRAENIEKFSELALALVRSPGVEAQMGPLPHMTLEKCVMLICGIEGLIDRAARRDEDLMLLAPDVKSVIKRVLAPGP